MDSCKSTTDPHLQTDMSATREPPDRSSARFYQRVAPTFSLDAKRRNPIFQFLDNSDPDRATVVRRKAREWVNNSKEDAQKSELNSQRKTKIRGLDRTQRVGTDTGRKHGSTPTRITELTSFDAFGILPGVRKDSYHIVQYFLNSPFMWDALPCCDDKHILDNDKTLAMSTRENSIMWNMARGEVSFVVWLHSTVVIRDGMRGEFNTPDIQFWYTEALRKIRQELADQVQHGKFSEHLVTALACIQATSSFSGMFETAVIHHSAMTKILKLRGNGDILAGLKQSTPWSMRAIQWCEFFVSAEQVQLPDIPYYPVNEPIMLPTKLVAEAVALAKRSKENLPFFRGPLHTILYQLHQMGLIYAHAPSGVSVDLYVAGTLYDTEYALLEVLASQKQNKHEATDVETLLAATFQLYLWIGPRRLRPQTRLCSLLASRVAWTLCLFVPDSGNQNKSQYTKQSTTTPHLDLNDYSLYCQSRPRTVSNLVAWSLALGTVAGAAAPIPEYQWLKQFYAMHLRVMGLDDNINGYRSLVSNFPQVGGFDWIDLEGLYREVWPASSVGQSGTDK